MSFSLVPLLTSIAQQMPPVDPNQGTARAREGAAQRLQDPQMYDVVFPIIAFMLVMVVPTLIAIWVIYKTVTDKKPEADES